LGKKRCFALLVFILVTSILPISEPPPAAAWDYTDGTPPDTDYDTWGPKADRIFIKLYDSEESEFDALRFGEIDITDWPLTKAYYDAYTTPPENESIAVFNYGAEFGLFLLDINWNNNTYLGDPPDPAYPNPVYPNPCADVNFRKAIWYLHDKPTWLPEIIGEGFYYDLYTPVPPSFGIYSLPMENPYPYDPDQAAAILEASGFPWHDDDGDGVMDPGERFWDRNRNGVRDPGEDLTLKFFIRTDKKHMGLMGDKIADEMNGIGIAVERIYGPLREAVIRWFFNKEVHLYTEYLELPIEPYYIVRWNSYFYWHPGKCPNTGFVNDPILDEYSWNVYFAYTIDEAITNCHAFQERFAEIAAAVPWWSYNGVKAMYRTYTGGTAGNPVGDPEDIYRGAYWNKTVNAPGRGIDNFWSILNMHASGHEIGDGENMTIRQGFSTSELNSLNPLYAPTEYDWKALDLIYEPLIRRDPYDPSVFIPWFIQNFTVGTYDHPVYGFCSKIRLTLDPDVYWLDGTPITAADVIYTFCELDDDLRERGLPPPVLSKYFLLPIDVSLIDPYNVELLWSYPSLWILSMLCEIPLLPRHVWKPIICGEDGIAGTPDDPPADTIIGFSPDPNLIGSGPYRLCEYVPHSHILMCRNQAGKTKKTNLEGSTPVESKKGSNEWRFLQLQLTVGDGFEFKIQTGTIEFKVWCRKKTSLKVEFKLNTEIVNEVVQKVEGIVEGAVNTVKKLATSTVNFIKEKHTWVVNKIAHWLAPLFEKKSQSFELLEEISGNITRNCTLVLWVTIPEDIVGSTFYDDIGMPDYPYKNELPSPDIKVDIKDIAYAAWAFGSYPGHERWSIVADITGDYKIDIKDIAQIARKFGWTP